MSKFFKVFFACVVSALLTSSLHAENSSSVENLFEISFYNKGSLPDYFVGWCHNNIYNLTSRLQKNGIDLSGAEVWFIYQRDSKGALGTIYPQQSRTWAETGWVFHVILNLKNIVYDLDFTQEPSPIPLEQYVSTMFPVMDNKNKKSSG